MIIQYDTRPNATVDEKLRSLIESIQLAFGEVGIDATNTATSQNTDISAIVTEIRLLSDAVNSLSDATTRMNQNITSLDERVTALENPVTP